jgi:hypothetical protein
MRCWPFAVLALAVHCSPPPDGAADPTLEPLRGDRAPAYRDVEESFGSEAEQERWFMLKRALAHDFDDVCGDTFCEGDFGNLVSLSFRCSASIRTGELKSCLWLFAGSYESVTPSSGTIRPVAKIFQCKIPVQGPVGALLDALLVPGEGPLQRPLPGLTASAYDALTDCL